MEISNESFKRYERKKSGLRGGPAPLSSFLSQYRHLLFAWLPMQLVRWQSQFELVFCCTLRQGALSAEQLGLLVNSCRACRRLWKFRRTEAQGRNVTKAQTMRALLVRTVEGFFKRDWAQQSAAFQPRHSERLFRIDC